MPSIDDLPRKFLPRDTSEESKAVWERIEQRTRELVSGLRKPKRTIYTAGFLFQLGKRYNEVALIRKNRPLWQAGLWNGIGGHVEAGETPATTQRREFEEETGLVIASWDHFATLIGETFEVHFFRAFLLGRHPLVQRTDEVVEWHPLIALPPNVVPNLEWLIPMAHAMDDAKNFPYTIYEKEAA